MKIVEMREKPKKREHTITTINMDIIEYFYAASWEDITGDDDLMDLILTNGYYKQALVDAHGIDYVKINHRGVDHELRGSGHDRKHTIDVLYGNDDIVIFGIEYKNFELENINKVQFSL